MRALITGASGGIGAEFAKLHASKGHDLILTARSADKLEKLAQELRQLYAIEVVVLPQDLGEPNGAKALFDAISKQGLEISVLINNAGFGDFGAFADAPWDKTATMIQLNVNELVQLTYLVLPQMLARKQGYILNLGSVASFLPGPMMTVYYATKAFVLSFSEGLAEEVRGQGVHVSVLCPGPTASDFQARSRMNESKLLEGPFANMPSSAEVAKYGYEQLFKKKRVSIHGTANKLMISLTKLLPTTWKAKMMAKIQVARQ
ncbi:MAG: SDR family oxidoreductase [Schleiferiaceae bacterium]|nr:SDR family oxidoreductase [Schleiferiaceae bacterium]